MTKFRELHELDLAYCRRKIFPEDTQIRYRSDRVLNDFMKYVWNKYILDAEDTDIIYKLIDPGEELFINRQSGIGIHVRDWWGTPVASLVEVPLWTDHQYHRYLYYNSRLDTFTIENKFCDFFYASILIKSVARKLDESPAVYTFNVFYKDDEVDESHWFNYSSPHQRPYDLVVINEIKRKILDSHATKLTIDSDFISNIRFINYNT